MGKAKICRAGTLGQSWHEVIKDGRSLGAFPEEANAKLFLATINKDAGAAIGDIPAWIATLDGDHGLSPPQWDTGWNVKDCKDTGEDITSTPWWILVRLDDVLPLILASNEGG